MRTKAASMEIFEEQKFIEDLETIERG